LRTSRKYSASLGLESGAASLDEVDAQVIRTASNL
jgi:hypothetical protein